MRLGSPVLEVVSVISVNTLVMTIQVRDGDRGQLRKIAYDLITRKFQLKTNLHKVLIKFNLEPMDYFLLREETGELRTDKPLGKEALEDATSLNVVIVRVSIVRYYA